MIPALLLSLALWATLLWLFPLGVVIGLAAVSAFIVTVAATLLPHEPLPDLSNIVSLDAEKRRRG